ncbi:unnamed protein product [Echinostoma caproni]|uniref:Uncharacterized protein n=1 Tax=Echinostoma caproni TaxID=27848 RepID=A0A183AIN5_9TREM|nr:unnamed protein product [Echinostoma caproni]
MYENSLQRLSNLVTVTKLEAKTIKRSLERKEREWNLFMQAAQIRERASLNRPNAENLVRAIYAKYLKNYEYLERTIIPVEDLAYALQLVNSDLTFTSEQIKRLPLELFVLIGGQDRLKQFEDRYMRKDIGSWFKPESEMTNERILKPGFLYADQLRVLLHGSGLNHDRLYEVLQLLGVTDTDALDFVSFLFYLPLFVEAHQRLICDPLRGLDEEFASGLIFKPNRAGCQFGGVRSGRALHCYNSNPVTIVPRHSNH